jgi:regulatory protein
MTNNEKSADDALARIVRLVGVRDRAVKEMRERLAQEDFAEQQIEQALERAISCGILDDERFATSYVKGKSRSGWGAQRIERELKRFGIILTDFENYQDIADEQFDEQTQIDKAIQALAKHHSNSKNQHQAKYRYLISKGYSSATAQSAINHSNL